MVTAVARVAMTRATRPCLDLWKRALQFLCWFRLASTYGLIHNSSDHLEGIPLRPNRALSGLQHGLHSASRTVASSMARTAALRSRPSAMPRIVLAPNLPESGSLQRCDTARPASGWPTAPMFWPHRPQTSFVDRPSADAPPMSTTNPRGTWPFMSSATPYHRAFGDRGMVASTASIEPVDSLWPVDVDDVVGAGHHE